MSIASKALTFAALALLWAPSLSAADLSPVGRWRTIDEKTGAATGVIEVTQADGVLTGRIVKLLPPPSDPAGPVCTKCDGPEKGQHILGLTILKGFRRDGDEWDGGTILDPRSGSLYSCEIRVDEGGKKLFVRGYIGISLIGRTSTWIRDE